MAPCAVAFDLDGTLVDSMPLVIRTFTHAVEEFRARPTVAEVREHLGGPLDVCLRNLLGGDEHLVAARARLLAYENGREAEILPFAGARELLDALRRRGVALGVWTGRDRWSAERLLAAHGLAGYFSTVVCGDDLPSHKPDPAGLRGLLSGWKIAPAQALLLGDADVDVLGGHAAGVPTVLIRHEREISRRIRSLAARVVEFPGAAYAHVRDLLPA